MQSTKSSKYKNLLREIKSKFQQLKKASPTASLDDLVKQDILHDFFPSEDVPNKKSKDVIYAIVDSEDVIASGDATGKFPYTSSRGNKCVLIRYNYDANYIKSIALKNREAYTLTEPYLFLSNYFEKAGVKPNTWVMDNKTSSELKNALYKNSMTYQLVPAYTHRSNAVERAIQTWKTHFKTGLQLVDPDYPIKEWDRLLPQADITLNLLRAS